MSLLHIQAQEITHNNQIYSLDKVLFGFEEVSNVKFSFDSDILSSTPIHLRVTVDQVSFEDLKKAIENQTSFFLKEIAKGRYIVLSQSKKERCFVALDKKSNKPINEIEIYLKGVFKGVTDDKGFFFSKFKKTDTLIYRHLGFEELKRTIQVSRNGICDTLYFTPKIETLNEVVINEYLTRGVTKREDASINLSLKNLRVLPGLVEPDVFKSAQLLPGISSPTEDPASLYIRGGTPDENLILWDGIKIYSGGHFFDQISTFNPNIIKEVKIFKGGTSVSYGDRISGVVDITSDEDLTENLKIGGGLNFTHGDLYSKIPLTPNMGLLVAGRRSSTDIYDNIVSNNLARKVFQNTPGAIDELNDDRSAKRTDVFNFYDTNLKWIWKINDQQRLQVSSLLAKNNYKNNRNGFLDASGIFTSDDFLKEQNIGASISWENNTKGKVRQKAQAYYSDYQFDYRLFTKRIETEETVDYRQMSQLKDLGLSYDLQVPLSENQFLNIGYQYSHIFTLTDFNLKIQAPDINPEKVVEFIKGRGFNHTWYGEYNYDRKKWHTKLGMRYSWLTNKKSTFLEPRLFMSYKISKSLRLTSSFELKNQQLLQVNTFGDENPETLSLPVGERIWVLSGAKDNEGDDIQLPVLKSNQWTLGILLKKGNWNLDVEGYFKNLKDLNFFDNFILDIENDNFEDLLLGSEKRLGVDILLKKRFNNYRIWLGYSWINTRVSVRSVQSETFPNDFDQTHNFNISQTLKWNDFEFALGWNIATGSPFTKIVNADTGLNNIDEKGINGNRFPTYHRLDASMLFRFNIEKTFKLNGYVGVSFRNLYNRKNIIGQNVREEFRSNSFDTQIVSLNRNSLPFTPDVVFRLNF